MRRTKEHRRATTELCSSCGQIVGRPGDQDDGIRWWPLGLLIANPIKTNVRKRTMSQTNRRIRNLEGLAKLGGGVPSENIKPLAKSALESQHPKREVFKE
jgi:hypothetical protein